MEKPDHQEQTSSTEEERAALSNTNARKDFTNTKGFSGRYQSSWTQWSRPSILDGIKWRLSSTDNSKIPDKSELDEQLPVSKPDLNLLSEKKLSGIRITWLGHASSLVQMNGLNMLTDPVFSERVSFNKYIGPKRYRPAPCSVDDLPHIDVVLISHNHYDHLDTPTIQQLNEKFREKIWYFVPLSMSGWMRETGCKNVKEFDWWERYPFKEVTFVFTPTQHWSGRAMFDLNKSLWGAWCVLGEKENFFFAGDTGYDQSLFQSIGNSYGPFDLAAIPIGAYEPRFMMEAQHVDPEQAVRIHQDINAERSLGIHWGTFALANEYYLEPKTKLAEILKDKQLPTNEFFTLNHGESWSTNEAENAAEPLAQDMPHQSTK